MKFGISLAFLILTLVASSQAKNPNPDFGRWEKEIAALEEHDAKQKPARGTTVFVGSSSIRLWNLEKSFLDIPLVNHGFGGSTIADSVHFVDRLVLRLEPKVIVFYAGDNDLTAKSPEQVHADFEAFVKAIHAKLPSSKIVFIAIKPSFSRWKLFEKQQAANRLISETIAKDAKRLVYIDVVAPMLGHDGQPRPELFQKDMLHLNENGYAIWNKLLLPELK